jgi:hypothetical protein
MVTILNRLKAWLVVGLKLAFLGESTSRTYFMNNMCEHMYYSRLAQKVNCTHLFSTAKKGICSIFCVDMAKFKLEG